MNLIKPYQSRGRSRFDPDLLYLSHQPTQHQERATKYRLRARAQDGAVVWVGWFNDAEAADEFIWALFSGNLTSDLRSYCHPEFPAWLQEVPAVYDMVTVTFLTSGSGTGNQTYNVPANFSITQNKVEAFGAGSGATNATASNCGGGGAGGAYAKSVALALTPGGTTTYNIGAGTAGNAGTAGGDVWFGASSFPGSGQAVGAKGGGAIAPNQGSTSATGGQAASCYTIGTGAVAFSGGNGGSPSAIGQFGSGGGGGAGPNGNGGSGATAGGNFTGGGGGGAGGGGTNGSQSLGTPGGGGGTGTGGSANGGNGGTGTVSGAATVGAAGGNGTEIDATHGSGGGGGGGGGASGAGSGANGGLGGTYGGGGGGGGYSAGALHGAGSGGTQGFVAVTYAVFTGRSIQVSQTSTSVLSRTNYPPVKSVTQGNSLSAFRGVSPTARNVTQASTVEITVPPPSHGRLVLVSEGSLVSVQNSLGRMVFFIQTQAVSIIRNMGQIRSFATELVLTFRKTGQPQPFMSTVGNISTLRTGSALHFVISIGVPLTLVRRTLKIPFLMQSSNVLALSRVVNKVWLIPLFCATSLRDNMSKLVGVLNPYELILKISGVGRINVVSPLAALLIRGPQRTPFLSQMGQLVTVPDRVVGKINDFMLPNTLTFNLVQSRLSSMSMTLTASLRRTVQKLLRPLWPQHITLNRPIVGVVSITQTQRVRRVASIRRSTYLAMSQAASLRRRMVRALFIAQGQQWTLSRTLTHGVRLQNQILVTIDRRINQTITVALGQVVRLLRASGRALAFLIPQSVTLTARAVVTHLVLVSVNLSEVVSLAFSRGKFAGVSQGQTISLPRQVLKGIGLLTHQVVSLFPGPNVRTLNPSLFAFGLGRKRTVYEVPNVALTNALVPPIQPEVEKEVVAFDYGLTMAEGVKIVSAEVTCTVFSGVDEAPETRLIGYLVIGPSTRNGRPAQAVRQLVGTMVDGVVYDLQCVAQTDDGQALVLTSTLECKAAL